jgi:hypothetical protein
MSNNLKSILKNKAINSWGLFCLISIPISIAIVVEMLGTDLSTGDGVSSMIGYSVRFAVPLIFLVIAASSVQILFPGPIPMWWLRNRPFIGLSFAVAMAWQGMFIFTMSYFFRDYYYADVYLLRDELEGTIGYIFLPAMVLTSFHFGRKYLSRQRWKLIHKTGIYFLFAYPFSVYWWNTAHYYGSPDPIDYVYYWSGFTAFALRIAAWSKKRERSQSLALKVLGGVMIACGLAVSATGQYWQKPVSAFLTTPKWSADLELWLPYWPFEPYLSLFIIGFGTLLFTKTKA